MRYIFIILFFCFNLFADEVSLKSLNNLKIIQESEIKVVEFKAKDSIYLLKGVMDTKRGKRPIVFYMTKDLKYTFFGRGLDDQNQALYIKKDMSIYKKYANFTYGEGEKEYYLFTDPQCPYCKTFEKLLYSSDLKDKVKIYYFLYPLFFHKEAIPMSNYILSKKDKVKALKAVMINGSKEYKGFSSQKSKELIKNDEIAFDIVVSGTPSLFDNKGKRLNYQKFFNNLK